MTMPQVRTRKIGDLTLGFNTGSPGVSRGLTTSWTTILTTPEFELSEQAPSSAWNGFPLTEISLPGRQAWLLGEIVGLTDQTGGLAQPFLNVVNGGHGNLNGHFLLWVWDQAQRQWHVWTDRFGTLHAYYAQSAGSAVLGTSFRAVSGLASRRELDWTGLTGFCGFGFFPEDLTFYRDVTILQPATHYTFDEHGNKKSAVKYWAWWHKPDHSRSYDDTVAEFGSTFETVMREHLGQGRIAVPISGGLDSRSTVSAIGAPNPQLASLFPLPSSLKANQFWSYSYGYSEDSVETRIARQVADARSLPFHAFVIQPYLFSNLGQVLDSVEGFQDVTQCRQAAILDPLRANADFVIAAHWGDVWLDDMGLANGECEAEAVADHAFRKMAKKGRAWLLEYLCAPNLGEQQPEQVLRQFVADGMAPLHGIADPDFRIKAFKTDNWSFRWTLSSIRMFQAAAFPRLPFYDTRLADFFCTVPSDFVRGRRLQIDYLKRFAPDLAAIKWQPCDADLYHLKSNPLLNLPKRAAKKAWRLLAGKKVLERNWEVQFGGANGQEGLRHWLLRPGLRLHDFTPQPQLEALLRDFHSAPLENGRAYTISMLLSFSAWLEHYA